jgi:hypothetical protein
MGGVHCGIRMIRYSLFWRLEGTTMAKGPGKRSVSIGRDAQNAVVVTGDRSTVTQTLTRISLPAPESVDITVELAALRAALAQLAAPDAGKIENAISDAEDELQKPAPDKDEIGRALDRAIGYAQKADGFATAAETLVPHVVQVVGWLGRAGAALLRAFGLTI